MANVNAMLSDFRRQLRVLQDKDKVTTRELLGLQFDLYEIFMSIAEQQRKAMEEALSMAPPFMQAMVDKDTFEEVLKKRDEKEAKPATESKKGYI